MAKATLNPPDFTHRPPNFTPEATEFGDTYFTVINNINTMLTELYNRTGGSATLANNLPSPFMNFRNVIDGGDFTLNPWQRGTSISGIAATPTYVPDRFFIAGAAAGVSSTTVSALGQQLTISGVSLGVAGFTQAFAFGRALTASSLSPLCTGQILESKDSYRFQGRTGTLSFWAAQGSAYQGGALGISVIQGNSTDASATSAINAGWTGQTYSVSATQALTTTMTRYAFSGVVSSSTTQLGVLFNYTPTGSSVTGDYVVLAGVQYEDGAGPSNFEHRDAEVELALCQRYCYVVSEPASGVVVGAAMASATNRVLAMLPLPTPMRAAPSVTVTQGSFGIQYSGSYLALSSTIAGTTHTPNMVSVSASVTVVSNAALMLLGGGGIGSIVSSADY